MSSEKGDAGSTLPKAVVHKKILDAAASNPDASVEALTDEVAGASVALVERVLDEYGDPAVEDTAADDVSATAGDGNATDVETGDDAVEASDDAAGESVGDARLSEVEPTVESSGDAATTGDAGSGEDDRTGGDAVSEGATSDSSTETNANAAVELTERQRAILERIREHPEATQQDLAEAFELSQATISNHLNAITGFDWQDRRTFAERVLDDALPGDAPTDDATGSPGDAATGQPVDRDDAPRAASAPGVESDLEAVAARVERIDDRLDTHADGTGGLAADLDALGDRLDDVEAQLDRFEGRSRQFDGRSQQFEERFDRFEDRLEDLEARLDEVAAAVERVGARPATAAGDESSGDDAAGDGAGGTVAFGDAALASKVLRACLDDDDIGEDEEVRILESVVTGGSP